MRRIGALALVLCLAGVLAMPAHTWAGWLLLPPQDYSVGESPSGVAAGYLNDDGFLDLVTANSVGDNISVLLGNGDGTFQPSVDYATGAYPFCVAIGNFDEGTTADLVVANYGGNNISVFLGNGDGTFPAAVSYAAGDGAHHVAIGYLDSDTIQDLAVSTAISNYVAVFIGNGDGTFQAGVSYSAGLTVVTTAICDLDGDEDNDLAVANQGSDDISILIGNGDGTFQSAVDYSAGDDPRSITASDLDYDGDQDLVTAIRLSNSAGVFYGNGDGTVQVPVFYGTGSAAFFVGLGDLDGDGHVDLVVVNEGSDDVSVLIGNGNGTFQTAVNYDVGSGPRSAAIGDFDGDGGPDLAVVNFYDSDVSVLLGLAAYAMPSITSITDVGNDQGGQARVEWCRSGFDDYGHGIMVTGYDVYRRSDQYLRESGHAEESPVGAAPAGEGQRLDGWDYIATVPASTDTVYQYVAPTLCDSTELGGICWSVFFVRATTANTWDFFDSPPDSGYSVDNLAPEPPAPLRGEFEVTSGFVTLSWPPCPSADLQYYELCRGDESDFVPSGINRIYAGIDTVFVDMSSEWTELTYYKVAAVDFGGNRSEYSSISALATGVSGDELPCSFAVYPARPNPFNPTTRLAFDLPEPGQVSLHIFDASGRLVRMLLDEASKDAGRHAELWDGHDDAGRSAASGVYFYRVKSGGKAVTRRMVLLK